MADSKKNSGIDLISDITEIAGIILIEVTTLLGLILVKFTNYAVEKITNRRPLKAITSKMLASKKKAKGLFALGWSASSKKEFRFSELDTRKHTAVIGSTGSGKSVCLGHLQTYSLLREHPIIFFDPKCSVASIREFREMCQFFGKKAYIFSSIETCGASFNPLLDGDLDDISDRIISSLIWSEPFYKNECVEALDEALIELKSLNRVITLKNICELLKKHPNKKNIKGLLNQLNKLNYGEFGKLLNDESDQALSYARVRRERACLYVGISSMGLSSSGNILNKIFFGGLLTHCKEVFNGQISGIRDPKDHPISIYFDELSSIIHEGFIELQNKCRSAGVELTFATQCPSDIDRISPILTTQIFENTNNLFVFNQIVPEHTEFFARTFGTVASTKKTHVTEGGEKQDRGSEREVEEFLVHGNIFRQLRVGQCVFLQRIPKRVEVINVSYREAKTEKEQVKQVEAPSAL